MRSEAAEENSRLIEAVFVRWPTPAFAEFQRDPAQRCIEQPAPTEATPVGSYAHPGDDAASDQSNSRGPTCAYEATAGIDATPEQVWRVLTDIAAWPDWNSGCHQS